MASGREEDIKELYEQLYRTPHEAERRSIMDTIRTIKNESGIIRSMRERLVKAHRESNKQEIKDIHDYIKGKEKYGQLGK